MVKDMSSGYESSSSSFSSGQDVDLTDAFSEVDFIPESSGQSIFEELRAQNRELSDKVQGLTEQVAALVKMMTEDRLGYKLGKALESMKNGLEKTAKALGVPYNFLKDNFKKLGEAMVSAWKSVKSFFTDSNKGGAKTIKAIKDAMRSFGEAIKSFFKDTLAPVMDRATAPVRAAFYEAVNKIDAKVIHPATEKLIVAAQKTTDLGRSGAHKATQAIGTGVIKVGTRVLGSKATEMVNAVRAEFSESYKKAKKDRVSTREADKQTRTSDFTKRQDARKTKISNLRHGKSGRDRLGSEFS